MGPCTSFQRSQRVGKIQRSLTDASANRVSNTPPRTIGQQRRFAGGTVATHLSVGSRSHLFKVPPFANESSSRGFDDPLKTLGLMQAYYDEQRANATDGATTPEVQPEDWQLAQRLVNALKARPEEFARLAPALSNSINALQPLLDQPGQARYDAWTAVCRVLKERRQRAGNQAPATRPPAPPQRQVATPAAAPQRTSAVSCQAACTDLARLRDGIQTVNGRQQIDWRTIRAHVNSIVASDDFKTRFTSQQQTAFRDLQRLNATDAGRRGRFDAWMAVQAQLPHDTRPPSELAQFRKLLTGLISDNVWMTKDTDVLIVLCERALKNSGVWGKDVADAMSQVKNALDQVGGDQYARFLMKGLLDMLDARYPQVRFRS